MTSAAYSGIMIAETGQTANPSTVRKVITMKKLNISIAIPTYAYTIIDTRDGTTLAQGTMSLARALNYFRAYCARYISRHGGIYFNGAPTLDGAKHNNLYCVRRFPATVYRATLAPFELRLQE